MASMYLRGERYYFRIRRSDGSWTSVRSSYVRGQEEPARQALQEMKELAAATERLIPVVDGPLTLEGYSQVWLTQRQKDGVVDWLGDGAKLRDHVLPFIGAMELNSIRAWHLRGWIKRLRESGRKIGRKTRLNVYGVLKALFRDAKLDGVFVEESPCILPPSAFGIEHEKDPEWRTMAIFTRPELVTLITSDKVPEDRRVFYAVLGLGMCRLGEAAALRVRNIDLDRKPLGHMLAPRSHEKNWTKGRRAREVPIHPVLHELFKHWIEVGWEQMMGWPPGPDDLLIPLPPEHAARRRGDRTRVPIRSKSYCQKRVTDDLMALALRHRREHDLRRTGISLMREDGARKEILETITHNPRKDTIDMYTTFTWEAKCREVLKLKLDIPHPGGTGTPSGPNTGGTSTALVRVAGVGVAGKLATALATTDDYPGEKQILRLWRRRVLPPGPEGLCSSRYVRVRRFVSRIWVGPPAGRPERQPSLFLAAEPEDAARPQSPLNGHLPGSQAIPRVVVRSAV